MALISALIKLLLAKASNTRIVKATQELPNHPKFSSSIMELRISLSTVFFLVLVRMSPALNIILKIIIGSFPVAELKTSITKLILII